MISQEEHFKVHPGSSECVLLVFPSKLGRFLSHGGTTSFSHQILLELHRHKLLNCIKNGVKYLFNGILKLKSKRDQGSNPPAAPAYEALCKASL